MGLILIDFTDENSLHLSCAILLCVIRFSSIVGSMAVADENLTSA